MAYVNREDISLEVLLTDEARDDICRLIGKPGFHPDLEESEPASLCSGAHPVPAMLKGDDSGGSGCLDDDPEPDRQPAFELTESGSFAYYMKEVAGYPLLSQERETELALRIREGQDVLVRMIKSHAPDERPLQELNAKVHRLLSREKTFPGTRDKVLKLIAGSLERLVHHHPGHLLYSELNLRAGAIIAGIDKAKQELVKANLRLVMSIAKRYRGRGMSFDDLVQEGNMGLLKAVGRFDHTKGTRFSTYATWWVRQSIIRGIYDKNDTIRLPVHFIELKNLFFKVFYELHKELGREPTFSEVATKAKLPEKKVERVLNLAMQPLSLETPVGEDGQRLSDFIRDEGAPSPLDHCSNRELSELTRQLLSALQPREEKILRLRFGLGGDSEETLESIGRTFNVSKERIRQLEKKALGKLRLLNCQAGITDIVN